MKRSAKTRSRRKPISRRKIRTVKRTVRILCPLIVLGVIGVIFYLDLRGYLTGSERYRVEHIEVTGTNRTSEDRIIEYSRIRRENPIFSIGLRESAERIMEHPRVRDAAVAVTLPNRVSIHVVEREPVALVVFNKVYELDAERVILGEYKKGLSPKGPIISGVKKPDSLQDGVRLRDDGLKEALDMWRVFSSDAISGELTVSEIDIGDRDSLIMVLANKRYEIRWPRDHFGQSLYRLKHLWEETDGFPAVRRYVDLRFGDTIPTR